jgi:hypothetical protein
MPRGSFAASTVLSISTHLHSHKHDDDFSSMRSLAATAGERCPVIRRPKGAKGKIKTDLMWLAATFLQPL